MPRIIAAILLVAVLVVGGGIIATTAYQAGLSTASRPRPASGGTVVTPVVVAPPTATATPGWHPWLRLRVLRLPRDAVLPVHRLRADPGDLLARRPGPARLGARRLGRLRLRQGPRRERPRPWESHANEAFDEWHRRAHGDDGDRPSRAIRRSRPAPPDARPPPLPAPPDISSGGASRSTMRPMKTILVVDDEPKIATLARDYLEHAGFAVLTASDGPSALTTIRQRRPDLVVLDLGLPGLDGLDVTRELRRDSTIPIVMLTARDDELDKLLGLELGADDYLTKPFSPRELVARVRAVLRRADRPLEAAETIRAGDVVLDLPRMRTEVGGTAVELTPTEFQLLATLAARPGRIFTRSQLLDALHGVAFETYERAIDSHIKNLRRKLEPDPRQPRYVLTVYGVGYRFADDRATD